MRPREEADATMPAKIGARESMEGAATVDSPAGELTTDAAAFLTATSSSPMEPKRWSSPVVFTKKHRNHRGGRRGLLLSPSYASIGCRIG
jgi:hypothetical protein